MTDSFDSPCTQRSFEESSIKNPERPGKTQSEQRQQNQLQKHHGVKDCGLHDEFRRYQQADGHEDKKYFSQLRLWPFEISGHHTPRVVCRAVAIASVHSFVFSSDSASTITRATDSVPEERTTTRPLPFRSLSA